jgi:hypothetical protein
MLEVFGMKSKFCFHGEMREGREREGSQAALGFRAYSIKVFGWITFGVPKTLIWFLIYLNNFLVS